MKNQKTIYWIATGILIVFEGVMPALTGTSEMARAGMAHLGYPEYFAMMLATFKVLGVLLLCGGVAICNRQPCHRRRLGERTNVFPAGDFGRFTHLLLHAKSCVSSSWNG
jgi:hypothetical protein